MLKTYTKFAWALPVKVEVLGAHVEAYCDILPTLYTVRLCNRYGKGPNAHITKLPVEMVHHIEAFLVQAKRATVLPQWVQDFRCWTGKCKLIDHLDDAAILELYNERKRDWTPGSLEFDEEDEERDEESAFYRAYNKMITPDKVVTPSIRECIADMTDSWADEGEYDPCVGQDRWRARVGQPTSLERGKFDQYRVILQRDFGLDVWVNHVQTDDEPVRGDCSVSHSTIAYFRLPDVTGCVHFHEAELSDIHYSPNREKSESAGAVTLKLPATPSEKSLARFDHALKTLDLVMQESAEGKNQAHEGLFGGGMWTHTKATAVAKNGTKPSQQAKLTMFTVSEDDAEW